MAFVLSLEAIRTNDHYTKVLYTGTHLQYVAKAIPPGVSIGLEAHPDTSQNVMVVDGKGMATLGDDTEQLDPTKSIDIEPGTDYDLTADDKSWLRVLIIYSPPLYSPGELVYSKPVGEPMEPVEPSRKTKARTSSRKTKSASPTTSRTATKATAVPPAPLEQPSFGTADDTSEEGAEAGEEESY